MKSSSIKKAKSEHLLTVKVTAKEMADFWERAIDKIKPRIKIDGFREGRAPSDLIVKKVGRETVEAEALDIAISDTYFMAISEHKLLPVANPKIEIKKQVVVDPKDQSEEVVLEYTAVVSVIPVVTIPGLNKIRVKKEEPKEPTEEEVQKVLDYLRQQKASMKPVERAIKKGDWADIGYKGSVNGVAKEAMANEHHPLIVGEGNLIPGFEDEVIGLSKGDKKSFRITFPKDYHAKDVAGKKADFDVTVHEVKEVILPAFDVTFSKDFGYGDPAEMKKAIKDNLDREKKEESENKLREDVLKQLDKHVKADIPEVMFEQELDRMLHELKHKVEDQKLPWDAYLKQIKRTEEELKKELQPQAEKNVRLGLALGTVVKEQGIEVKDEKEAVTAAIDWLVKLASGKIKAKNS